MFVWLGIGRLEGFTLPNTRACCCSSRARIHPAACSNVARSRTFPAVHSGGRCAHDMGRVSHNRGGGSKSQDFLPFLGIERQECPRARPPQNSEEHHVGPRGRHNPSVYIGRGSDPVELAGTHRCGRGGHPRETSLFFTNFTGFRIDSEKVSPCVPAREGSRLRGGWALRPPERETRQRRWGAQHTGVSRPWSGFANPGNVVALSKAVRVVERSVSRNRRFETGRSKERDQIDSKNRVEPMCTQPAPAGSLYPPRAPD